jgi:F-type H+-transporting ATPase subunit b
MDLLTPDFGVFFWQSIILLVVIFILGKFAWKPALGLIKDREKFIENSLTKADECNKRVAKIEEECSEIVKGAQTEKGKIIQEALDDRKKIIDTAEMDAKNKSEQIVHNVEQAMKQYQNYTIQNSKNDIISLSVQIAEKLMGKELDDENKNTEFLNKLMDEVLTKKTNLVQNETL